MSPPKARLPGKDAPCPQLERVAARSSRAGSGALLELRVRWKPAGSWTPSVLPRYPSAFSSYDMCVVSDDQIQKWADEAEAGYDVDALKRRGRGRPGRGAEPMQVVAVRVTAEELDALDAAAAKQDMTRSEAIRAALAHFAV